MKTTIAALLLALALTACGGSGSDGTDAEVEALLEDYAELGATDAQVDQLADDIDAALDAIPDDQHDEYLDILREQLEASIAATDGTP